MKNKENYIVIGVIALARIASVFLRVSYIDYVFVDYVSFLSRWIKTIQENGYLSSLSEPFYNYTPLYMYILTVLAKININSLYSIKVVSFLFEYVTAFYIGRIGYLLLQKEWIKWIPFAIVPLVPTVFLNSTFMSQCDIFYVSFLLGSVYYLFRKYQISAMIFLGIALSLKAQAAFALPFYFVFLLRGHIKWYMFLIIPLVYLT